jgi:putative PIN family toxin of toxin-antitoxin system
MTEEKPGAVFDCNVFFQAARNVDGPAAKALRLFEHGDFSLFVSDEILKEVGVTFADTKVRAKNPWITDATMEVFLERIRKNAVVVQVVPEKFTFERDPDDAKYVNLTLAAGAKYLVTRDNDLLDLMDDANPMGQNFRKRSPGLMILDPVAFLQAIAATANPR